MQLVYHEAQFSKIQKTYHNTMILHEVIVC